MKIIVFGATGGTGKLVVHQLLDEGHEVTVIVRNLERFDVADTNIKVVEGDVLDEPSFENHIKGKDVVISTLGVNHRKPTRVYSEGTENIMRSMGRHGVNRLICLSSGTLDLPPDTPIYSKLFVILTIKRIFRNLYADMERMEEIVRRSNLEWTIIRPPRLADGPKTGEYRVTINEYMKNAKGIKGITRADLADCIVKQIDNTAAYKGIMDVSY